MAGARNSFLNKSTLSCLLWGGAVWVSSSGCCDKRPHASKQQTCSWQWPEQQKCVISHRAGGWEANFKEPSWLVSGENSPPGLQMVTFSLGPPVAFSLWLEALEVSGGCSSSGRDTSPIRLGRTL